MFVIFVVGGVDVVHEQHVLLREVARAIVRVPIAAVLAGRRTHGSRRRVQIRRRVVIGVVFVVAAEIAIEVVGGTELRQPVGYSAHGHCLIDGGHGLAGLHAGRVGLAGIAAAFVDIMMTGVVTAAVKMVPVLEVAFVIIVAVVLVARRHGYQIDGELLVCTGRYAPIMVW